MKLRYFMMFMNRRLSDKIYGSHFDFHTYFIGHYLSMQLRKFKFETDGTFDAIYIQVGMESPSCEVNFLKILKVNLPFDFELYDNANQTQKYNYYLDLIHEGLQIASRHKNIPLAEINDFITSLVENNFIYTWDFKNLRVPEYNLKVKFTCQLGTDDFILKITAFRNKVLEPVCKGVVIRTKPDSIYFSYVSKKILVKDDRICIFSKSGNELMTIKLKSLIEGNLIIDFSESPYPDNENATETFKDLQKMLRYDNYDFK